MSRLPLAEPATLPDSLRRMHDESGDNTPLLPHLARVFAPAPELLESFIDWYFPWHMNDGAPTRLPVRTKELVRLRLATFSGCQACKTARLAEDVIPETEAVGVDDGGKTQYSPSERAALAFAEKMALDHFSIGDDDFAVLREHFDDAQILELIVLTGVIYLGFGRALSVLQLEEVSCPLPPRASTTA